MKKLAPLLAFGIPFIIFVLLAYRGFATNEKGLAVVGMVFAVLCVLAFFLLMNEVKRKDKELAERIALAKEVPPAPEKTDTPPEEKGHC